MPEILFDAPVKIESERMKFKSVDNDFQHIWGRFLDHSAVLCRRECITQGTTNEVQYCDYRPPGDFRYDFLEIG